MAYRYEVMELWQALNAQGAGDPIGDEDDSPGDALRRDGWEVVDAVYGQCVIGVKGISVAIVCDANGPWAVIVAGQVWRGYDGNVYVDCYEKHDVIY